MIINFKMEDPYFGKGLQYNFIRISYQNKAYSIIRIKIMAKAPILN